MKLKLKLGAAAVTFSTQKEKSFPRLGCHKGGNIRYRNCKALVVVVQSFCDAVQKLQCN